MENLMENLKFKFKNGVEIINVTPHSLTFEDEGEIVTIPASGIVINAKAIERTVREGLPALVATNFVASEEDTAKLEEIERTLPGVIPVGSIIAAQAFPGRVFGMTPMPGYERVAPEKKRMNPAKYTTFEGQGPRTCNCGSGLQVMECCKHTLYCG